MDCNGFCENSLLILDFNNNCINVCIEIMLKYASVTNMLVRINYKVLMSSYKVNKNIYRQYFYIRLA